MIASASKDATSYTLSILPFRDESIGTSALLKSARETLEYSLRSWITITVLIFS